MKIEVKAFPRTVLLNALPLNSIKYSRFNIYCRRTTLQSIADIVKHSLKVENYISHESTARFLSRALGLKIHPSCELYEYRDRDIMIIVTLKKPVRGTEVEVEEEDLEYFICSVEHGGG
jgi:hypothetical protein